jgi:hypothetical protein
MKMGRFDTDCGETLTTADEMIILPIAYCLLPIAYCLLPIAYCLLPIAYCPVPIATLIN